LPVVEAVAAIRGLKREREREEREKGREKKGEGR
jgi:hypothetical protein